MRRNKLTFNVKIDEHLDELFGNCRIEVLCHHETIAMYHTHIPLSELCRERVQKEIQKIIVELTGASGDIKQIKPKRR